MTDLFSLGWRVLPLALCSFILAFGLSHWLIGLVRRRCEQRQHDHDQSQYWYVNHDQHTSVRRARLHDMRQRMRRRNGKPDVWGMDRQDPPQGRAS